jgi:antitoxin component YwqK of YwqJK toxin-antitoxin module
MITNQLLSMEPSATAIFSDEDRIKNVKDNELFHSNSVYYINGQQFFDCYYDNKKRKQGKYFEFYEDGSVLKECSYLDDKLHGAYEEYHTQKSLLKYFMYEYGNLHGEYFEFYPTGVVRENAFYVNGQKHGISVTNFSDGTLYSKSKYNTGVLDGMREEYSSDKFRKRTITFWENGREIKDKDLIKKKLIIERYKDKF